MKSLRRLIKLPNPTLLGIWLSSLVLAATMFFLVHPPLQKPSAPFATEPAPDSPAAAMAWRRLALQDEFGRVAPEGLLKAIQAREDNLAYWRARGRTGLAGLTPAAWISRGPQNIGGRTRALLVHPQNPNWLIAAAASGGVWRSENGGQTWLPANDFLLNLAANCLAMDPQNPNVMYCGTGEGFFNADAVLGAGIFKSTDAGVTWNQLASTANWPSLNRGYVNKIAVAPNNGNVVLAAVRDGAILRSTDGGQAWTRVRNSIGAFDVEFNPADANKAVCATLDNNGQWYTSAYFSNDGGLSWSVANFIGLGTQISGFTSRIELAYAPASPNIVYASFDNTGNGGRMWRSTDGGQNYQLMTLSGNLGGNYWYNNTLWVSPFDPNFVVAGGTFLFKSTDGGATLTQISTGAQLHVDHHFIVADPGFNAMTNRRVYVCSDGGVFRTDDIFNATNTSGWVSLNNTYQTTQYYGAAGHGGSGLIIGGTQDNGTLRSLPPELNATQMFGGDGGFNAVDPSDDTYCYGEYVFLQIRRSQNRGLSSSYIYQGIFDAGSGSTANFIAPFLLDPNDPNRLLAGGRSLWRTNNARQGAPVWAAIRGPGTDNLSAIAVANGNPNLIWVAQNDGKVYLTQNGLAATPTWLTIDDNSTLNPLPNRYPTRILIDPTDHNKVYLSFGGYNDSNLQRTLNGGATWADVTGNGVTGLPLSPIRGLARHPFNPNWLYVGTEVGVFSSEDGAATWAATNQGPANVSVDEVVFMHNSERLLAATHGRGVWTAQVNCLIALTPPSRTVPAAGGNDSFTVTSDNACAWAAISSVPWITVTGGATGTGNGTVQFSVSPNTGLQRSGTINVNAQVFTVLQETGCPFVLTPMSQSFSVAAGAGSVTVSGPSACTWTAVSNASWLTITSGSSGVGNGAVSYTVARNETSAARQGTLTIATQTFTVNQAACPAIGIEPSNLPVGTMGVPYSHTLNGNGGTAPYSFTLIAGALPNGLALANNGFLAGTTTNIGSFNFSVQVQDANQCPALLSFTLVINPANCGALVINPDSLPAGKLGLPYDQTLTASGGIAPYNFILVTGALPDGLSLNNSTGGLSGIPTAPGTFSFIVVVTDANSCRAARAYQLFVGSNGMMFYPLAQPVRLLDTRPGQQGCFVPNAPIISGIARTQPARVHCAGLTIPASATALTGNVTTVQSGGGFLTLYPSDAERPTVASINYSPNEIINNVFTVGLGTADGAFNIYAHNTTDVVVDVTGYYAPPSASGLYFHPLPAPVRLLETRAGFPVGCVKPGAPLVGGMDSLHTATSACTGIPAAARAIVGNATTVNPLGGGFLTIFPADAARPLIASSNFNTGQIVNGPFSVGLTANGQFKIYTTATTDLVVDVLGYYSTEANDVNGAGLLFNPLPRPVRLLETRPGLPVGCFKPGLPLPGGSETLQTARGLCDGITIPANALGVVGNATVVFPVGAGFLTLWPSTAARPLVATSNYNPGDIGNRHFTVGLGNADGALKLYTHATADLVVDLSGYFAP